jgi:hypothetical protein
MQRPSGPSWIVLPSTTSKTRCRIMGKGRIQSNEWGPSGNIQTPERIVTMGETK